MSQQVLRLSAGGGEAVPVAEPSFGMRVMYKLDGKVRDYLLNSLINDSEVRCGLKICEQVWSELVLGRQATSKQWTSIKDAMSTPEPSVKDAPAPAVKQETGGKPAPTGKRVAQPMVRDVVPEMP